MNFIFWKKPDINEVISWVLLLLLITVVLYAKFHNVYTVTEIQCAEQVLPYLVP